MLNRILVIALLTIASAVTATSQAAAKDDKYWALSEKYCNARFGFCVRYPASLMKDRAPENDDGRRFDNGNSLVMTVSGINNVLNDTRKSEMRSARDEFDRITYQAQGKNWFVLSGQKNDVVIYLKTFVGRGSINHLRIETSVHLNKGYRKVVGNIARSFRPGQLGASH